jgi:hypothetical protein
MNSRFDVVALGHSAALVSLIEAPPLTLPTGVPPSAALISEFLNRSKCSTSLACFAGDLLARREGRSDHFRIPSNDTVSGSTNATMRISVALSGYATRVRIGSTIIGSLGEVP